MPADVRQSGNEYLRNRKGTSTVLLGPCQVAAGTPELLEDRSPASIWPARTRMRSEVDFYKSKSSDDSMSIGGREGLLVAVLGHRTW